MYNREQLNECPESMVNVGLKGQENIEAFNKTVLMLSKTRMPSEGGSAKINLALAWQRWV